jgi:hypothetical protein
MFLRLHIGRGGALRLAALVVLSALLLPSSLRLISRSTDQSLIQQVEGRQEASLPQIKTLADLTSAKTYQQFSAVLSDQIGYRILLARWRNSLNYYWFGQNRFGQIDIGPQGWLFYLPSYSGQEPWSLSSLQSALANLQQFLNWGHRHGLTVRVVLVPEKQQVYPEQLPPLGRLTVAAYAPLTQPFRQGMQQMAGDRPEVLDFDSVLQAAKASGAQLLYNPVDSHYTPYAALLLTQTLLASLKPNLWTDQDVMTGGTQLAKGDLLRILNIHPNAQQRQTLADRNYVVQRPCVTPLAITSNQQSFDSYASFQTYLRDDRHTWNIATVHSRSHDAQRCPLIPGRTLLVGDSGIKYYLAASLPQYFEQLTLAHWDAFSSSTQFHQQLSRYDTVILQSAERLTVDRFNRLLSGF